MGKLRAFSSSLWWSPLTLSSWLTVSPVHTSSCILSLAFWRPSQEDRIIEILGLSWCQVSNCYQHRCWWVCIIWQGCKQGVHYLDEIRTIRKQLDDAAKARGMLQVPLNRQKVLTALGYCKDCLGVAPLKSIRRKQCLAGNQWATYFQLMPDKKCPKKQGASSRVGMIDWEVWVL